MKRIKNLHIVSGLAIGDQSGGAEKFAASVARLLNKERFETAVFATWSYPSPKQNPWLEVLNDAGIPIYGMLNPTGNYIYDLVKSFIKLWQSVNEFQPEIITTHNERAHTFNAIIHTFHPLKPFAVRTIHIEQSWQTHPWIGKFLSNLIFPRIFDAEIAVSATICDQLNAKRGNSSRHVQLCYNGIDQRLFDKPGDPVSFDGSAFKPSNSYLIGTIGRLADQKGHQYLLKAFPKVLEKYPAHLLIIGSGPLRSNLENLASELKISKNTHFLGSRDDISDIIGNLDLFVLPSIWEGFPTVLLEAMAQEVPVVVTNISGSRELVQNKITGLIVPPEDSTALANAINLQIENHEDALKMAQNDKIHASQYTIQNTTLCFEKIYKDICPN